MRKLTFSGVLGMALSAAAIAQVRSATLQYTYLEGRISGYRLGEEFYLPLTKLTDIGWAASTSGAGARISAEGSTFNVPVRICNGQSCIPFRQAVQQAGAGSLWMPGGFDQLEVLSPIYEVSVVKGELSLKSGLNVRPRISVVANGDKKVIIDFDGSKLTNDSRIQVDGNAKVLQYNANTVRVTIEMDSTPVLPKAQIPATQHLRLAFNAPPLKTGIKPVEPPTIGVKLKQESQELLDISIALPKSINRDNVSFRTPEPNVMEVVIPSFSAELSSGARVDSRAVQNVIVYREKADTVLRFRFNEVFDGSLSQIDEGVGLRLFRKSQGVGNLGPGLAGKIIVIDAGHGGKFPGASYGPHHEKDITLKVAGYLQDLLTREGATVIMTRSTDCHLHESLKADLEARAVIANQNGAHAFISIHVNSVGGRKASPSGMLTFYHYNNPGGKLLSDSIHAELKRSQMIPGLGSKSDRTLYNGGLSVLRNTKMPSVLIELGFLDNAHDRAILITDHFHSIAAAGIVRGLRIFFGG